MTDVLEFTLDKFTFQVPADRYYTDEGLWARLEDDHVWIGLSDFAQQRSGDVAFAEVRPEGAWLDFGDEVAVIETIKVDITFSSPVTGEVVEVNPAMEVEPEVINQDPYGDGWLAVLEAKSWASDRQRLLTPEAYLEAVKREAEEAEGL